MVDLSSVAARAAEKPRAWGGSKVGRRSCISKTTTIDRFPSIFTGSKNGF